MLKRLSRYRAAWGLLAMVLVWTACQQSGTGGLSLGSQEAKALIEAHGRDPNFVILDVRTPAEFQQGHIAGAVLMDYYSPQFKQRLAALDHSKVYLLYCRSGSRSGRAVKMAAGQGFAKVDHLAGGILDWRSKGFALVR